MQQVAAGEREAERATGPAGQVHPQVDRAAPADPGHLAAVQLRQFRSGRRQGLTLVHAGVTYLSYCHPDFVGRT